ncbi:alanine/glycine:cation symporter family protein [Gulosibacter massiliensis]|uniref:alanine/glycine:cation symporter family protein n=1 Tax=Gulosibacter massiliensis TaxID=2479839 RepID=UPI000F6312E3|nr:sodium:alanine symporter family protein [Gulosibacter massiliensis]
MDQLQSILDNISTIVWGPWFLIPLLLGTGLFLTIRLRFLQFRKLGVALNLGIIRRNDDTEGGDISQYQALTTALAATVGVGNIVGVATAIAIGGPGALFWMWITGLLGMASKYAEAFLGVRFRTTDERGEKSGGPMYYLQRGIKGPFGKFLAYWFAIFAFIASFGIGNLTQGNAVAGQVEGAFGVPHWVTGVVLTVVVGLVLLGGIKRIGTFTSAFVPLMILIYIITGFVILVLNAPALPQAFAQIFTMAFSGTSAVGVFAGSALILVLQMGVARGIFSNESGMGSAAIAAAAAKTTHPVRQGLVSMTQTFIDTIIVVTFTGLIIVSSGVWQQGNANGEAGLMTSEAFAQHFGAFGSAIVAVAIAFFAFSTILGWAYYGERSVEMLVGVKGVYPYRILFTLVVFVGCTIPLSIVWSFSDVANGLMALPNLIGLLILSGLIARETKHYLDHDPKLTATSAQIDKFMVGHERHD